jgi:drug/metabolite transporter (DMT)-like permease
VDPKRIKAYVLLLITAVIWGIASPVIKYTLRFIQPFSFLFWRFLIVSLVFLPVFFIYKKKKKIKLSSKKVFKLALLGFLGTTLSLGLLFLGYKYTTAIDGSLIYSIAPIIVVIGGAIFLKEKVTKMERVGVIIAFLGSLVIVLQPILEGKAFALKNIYGNVLILLSAIAWATYCLLVCKTETREKTDPLVLTAIGFFVGFLTIIPIFLLENLVLNDYLKSVYFSTQPLFHLNPAAIPGILYMSFFSSVIAYFIYNLGYSLIEASEATIFDYLKPVFAAPLAILWLGEKITPPFLLGALIIFLGVLLTEYRPRRFAT